MNTVGTPTSQKKGPFNWLTPARMIWIFYVLVCAISISHMSYYFGMEESKNPTGQILSYAYALCIDIGQGAVTWGVISVAQSNRKHKWFICGFMTFILLGLVAFSYVGNVTYAMGNTDLTLLSKANKFVFTGWYTYIASLLPVLILIFTLVSIFINQQDPLANMSAVQIATLRKEQEEARTILIQMEQNKLVNDGLEANLAISRAQLQGSKFQGIVNGLIRGQEKPEESPSPSSEAEEPTRFVAQPVQDYQTILEVDKLTLTLDVLRVTPDITDEELAEHLGLKRAASARFWKLKAREILSLEASPIPLAKVTTGPLMEYAFVSTQNEYEIEGRTYWTAKRAANEWEIAESRVRTALTTSAKRSQLPTGSWLPLKHGDATVYVIDSALAPHYREWIAGRTQLTLVQATGTGGN